MLNTNLLDLQPQTVWAHFNQLLNIPRTSGNEQGVQDYLLNFAKTNNLNAHKDEVGNVIIKKASTDPNKGEITIILQAHMDMVGVCEKNLNFDFKNSSIQAYIDTDGFVKAKGTTLGADNGIGMSIILALFEDPNLKCGNLKAIFTVEEESTMKGATNLQACELQGDYLLNLDSEEDGYLYVSCAGSEDCVIDYTKPQIECQNLKFYTLELQNLSGGHSGTDINLARANAIITVAKALKASNCEIYIQSIDGGHVRNAIANHASVTFALSDNSQIVKIKDQIEHYKQIHKITDPNFNYELKENISINHTNCFNSIDSRNLLNLIIAIPNGALRMFDQNLKVVDNSLNLGVIKTTSNTVTISTMYRALNESGLDDIKLRLLAVLECFDKLKINFQNRHPAWSSPSDNALIRTLKDQYQQVTGKPLQITAMPAGLECSFFAKANPNLQLASVGPSILNPHSTSEKVSIQGVKEIFETIKLTLEAIK